MKTWQLLVLRAYMATFGRNAFFAGLLRRALVLFLVKRSMGRAYHASSRFFSPRELE